ncbi:hypothetical protein N9239_00490 [bacterium]|nr:hypothetical protein [bacterium]
MKTETDESLREIDLMTESCDAELERLLAPCEELFTFSKQDIRTRTTGNVISNGGRSVKQQVQTNPISPDSISPEHLEKIVNFLQGQSGIAAVKLLTSKKLTHQVIRVIYHSLPISMRLVVAESDFTQHVHENAAMIATAITERQRNKKTNWKSTTSSLPGTKYYVRRGTKKPRGPISTQQIHEYIAIEKLLASDFFSETYAGPWQKITMFPRGQSADKTLPNELPEGAASLENVLTLSAALLTH